MTTTHPTASGKLRLKHLPPPPASASLSRFWVAFKHPSLIKLGSSINSCAFSPADPNVLAVSSGPTARLYDASTSSEKRSFPLFKDVVRCAQFRSDGKLLLVGGDDQKIHLLDPATRSALRIFSGHKDSVHQIQFGAEDPTKLLSASHDKTARMWDVPSETTLTTFTGHTDYVRDLQHIPNSQHMVATGAYDHQIRLWDVRTGEAERLLDHGAPVESIAAFASGTLLASAGSHYICVWDIVSGSLLHRLSNHQKTITCLRFDTTNNYLLSGSLDQQVKMYDAVDFSVQHSFKYTSPVLAMDINNDNSHLAVGMADGSISVRKRGKRAVEEEVEEVALSERPLRGGTHRHRTRGKNTKPSQNDFMVEETVRVRLRPYEVYLRKFQYKDALNEALKTKNPLVIVSLMEELVHRNSLHLALGNRTDTELEPVISFLQRYLTNPRFAKSLTFITHLLLDQYGDALGQSSTVDSLLLDMQRRLHLEIRCQEELYQLLGSLEMASRATC